MSPVGIPAFICIILPGMAGLDRSPDSPAQAARSPLQMRVGTSVSGGEKIPH
jgi:hypothetical protein